jgi:bacteriorhodopsin
MKLAFGLFALAAAQDGASAQTQDDGAQSQGAQSQGAQDQGGYGGESAGYEAEPASYGEAAIYRAPDICLTACPKEAPCQHPSGGCAPKSCGGEVQSYGGEAQSGYRRLQDGSQGAQGGYGQAQQSYGGEAQYAAPAAYAAPQPSCGCPYGTTDTSGNVLSNTWVLWIGFALLFIPAMWFLCYMFGDLTDDGEINGSNTQRASMGLHRVVAGFICVFASLAYLTMATGHGYITRCCDGRTFFYARYIDWTLTTPLMIWELSSLAREVATIVANENGTAPTITSLDMVFLIFMDLLMIISGLIGSLICGGSKWVFFGFSMLAFIPILSQLCSWDRTIQEMATAIADLALSNPSLGTTATARVRNYRNAMNITVITWFFYPVVWVLAEGTGTISANAEAICYTVLDVLAKSVFGFIIVSNMQSPQ